MSAASAQNPASQEVLDRDRGGEILEALVVDERTAPPELVIRDATRELEQSVAAEAVRFQDLLGCAHSFTVRTRFEAGRSRVHWYVARWLSRLKPPRCNSSTTVMQACAQQGVRFGLSALIGT